MNTRGIWSCRFESCLHSMSKIIYIAHPISGNIDENLKDIIRIIRKINDLFSDVVPCVPYYADILALDDNKIMERMRGIENNIELIQSGVFEELWLTGTHISFGMNEEIKLFKLLGKTIVDWTNLF